MKYVFEKTGKEMKLNIINEEIPEANLEIVLTNEYQELILIFTREIFLEEMDNKLFMRMASHEIEELTK